LFFLLLLFISAGKPEESKKKLREPVNGLRKRTKNKAEETLLCPSSIVRSFTVTG